jgi:hypothetical protein
MTLFQSIEELISLHGSLRAAARVKKMDAGYLCRLHAGVTKEPSARTLRKLGLKRVVSYERDGGSGR